MRFLFQMALLQVYQWLKKGLLAGAWILSLQDFFIHFKNFTKCLVYSPFQVLGIHTRQIERLQHITVHKNGLLNRA